MSDSLSALFSAWGMTDEKARADTIAASVGDSFYYSDPNTPEPVTSANAFVAYLAMFTQHMPGGSAGVASSRQTLGHVLAEVDFFKGDTAMMRGQYFADLDADGKILRLVGFIGTEGE